MDPKANLQQQRRLAHRIHAEWESTPEAPSQGASLKEWEYYHDSADEHSAQIAALGAELAELVQALDAWRTSGGFDPYAN